MSAARLEGQGTGRRQPDPKACQRLAEQMLALTLKAGADGAEVLVRDGTELEVKVRLGEIELVKEAGSRALGLRVVKDARAAVTYTSDFSPAAMERFARESVELASLAEPDPAGALPGKEEVARELPDLDLWDEEVLSLDVAEGLRRARLGEAAALKLDKRITNSDGAVFGRSVGASAFATSAGFSGSARGTHVSFAVEPLCDDADGKKRNGVYWSAARFASALGDPEAIGLEAARRTLAKLGARKIPTGAAPVVFSPEAGRGLVGQLAGVLSGGALWRRSTYLAGREGTAVASPLVELVDDPLIRRAPGSRAYDGEGLPSRTNVLISGGQLRTFLFDVYAARKLGRRSTGSASRAVGGGPHVGISNLILRPGRTPAAEIERLERGLYVTDLMGFGFNGATGDYSQGAGGFWIERGERAFPVTEITVSLGFDDLWKRVDAVGDDLDTRSSVQCPTFRVSEMMIAGS
ncbi:MAG TPA: metallopeptidase TldD-related protein [Polyangia bacterium]|nr:metallopeptidase TldD-related protein [Polyangia bacterium]